MRYIIPIFILFQFLFLTACEFSKKQGEKETVQGETNVPDSVQYTTQLIRKMDNLCDDSLRECSYVQIKYPEVTGGLSETVRDELNGFIKDQILDMIGAGDTVKTLQGAIHVFIADYQDFKSKMPETFQTWIQEIDIRVLKNDTDIFSMAMANDSYLGGAHPNYQLHYVNFNVKTGHKLGLEDIIAEREQLNTIAEVKFRKLKNIDQDQNLSDADFLFENDKFAVNDNFAITNDKLIFYFNDYEIASYAQGPTSLEIPLSEISHLLKNEFKADQPIN
ncbi:DUF3298 domain-containing protein [Fulvivirgaceae bacterium BMA10]|uniref:DUF3298 domain-containing protein n=1 Tax=Splendidivirga corallicola TaxID=3051826 RepID=A0ABT8KJH7_9BACT|nr:DUF3298 domain-containing protein [Fulvivirgaceae bacterium BMA10]